MRFGFLAKCSLVLLSVFAASFLQAESGPLNRLVVRQWISLSEDGSFRGTVVIPGLNRVDPVADAEIMLVDSARKTRCTLANDQGEFAFGDLQPGTYGLYAKHKKGTAVYALHLLPKNGQSQETLQVSLSGVTSGILKRIARGYLPATQPSESFSVKTFEEDPLGKTRIQRDLHQVIAQKDFGFIGNVRLPALSSGNVDLSSLNAMVFKGDKLVSRVEVKSDGNFRVDGIEPGVYGLVVAGEEGLAITSFELVSEKESIARYGDESVKFTASQAPCCEPSMNIEIAPVPIADAIPSACCGCSEAPVADCGLAQDEAIADCGCGDDGLVAGGYGGYGGGYGGYGGGYGGGFGGGFGGLGGLGLAGLAAGIAAAASGGGDEGGIPPPASPAIP